MSPATRKLLARRSMDRATSTDYVDWALAELVSGADTPGLRILAGLPKPPYWPEVERYFERTMEEMGWSIPEPRRYLGQYVREVAQAIVSGETPPREGLSEIYQVWEALQYPSALENWVYLGDGLSPDSPIELEGAELEAAIRREAERLLREPDALW